MIWTVGAGAQLSEVTGDETMARQYDDDIMAEFSKIERMISEQVNGNIFLKKL